MASMSSSTKVLMSAMPSIRSRALFPLFAAVVVAVACSSGSATGPDTSQNEQLILHFDTLKNSTSGIPPGIYLDIATILAEGAPVGNGTLTINGVALHVHTVAQRAVEYVQGEPLDSGYVVGAWTGDGSDTVIELLHSGFFAATRDLEIRRHERRGRWRHGFAGAGSDRRCVQTVPNAGRPSRSSGERLPNPAGRRFVRDRARRGRQCGGHLA